MARSVKATMNNIILKNITVKGNRVCYEFVTSEELDSFFNSNVLWIEYDEDLSACPVSVLSIPFVSIMLPIMWVTNSVLWVEDLDHTFYEATFNIRRAFQDLYPNYPLRGRLVAAYQSRNTVAESEDCFLLFSGGVDAHTSFIRNRGRVSRLVNIQGFYNLPEDENTAAVADFRDISCFAESQGKLCSFVKSNFAVLISTERYAPYAKKIGDELWHGFQHSMAFISITMPLAFKHGCSKILIASSFTIGDSRVCASYPTTDNEFLFAGCGYVIHDGFELSRQDKIHTITSFQKAIKKPYPIRVCSFNDHNCCECEKCFRTVLGLTAECADIRDFGFCIDKPLKEHWAEVMYNKSGLMGLYTEKVSHWPYIIDRMRENYSKMNKEQQEFTDWFLSFDFEKMQKKSRFRYYRQNFFSIVKRKLGVK